MSRPNLMSYAVLVISLAGLSVVGCKNEQQTPSAQHATEAPGQPLPPVKEDPQALRDFSERVQAYVKLHKDLEASLPRLKPTKEAEVIAEHRRALAEKLREARAGAKQGDIFTPAVSAQLVQLIRRDFRGPEGPVVRETIRQGSPLKDMPLRVGADYPENLPVTTMPPALLQSLPELPKEVVYRIVGRDLILHDTAANIIVDFIPEALPKQAT